MTNELKLSDKFEPLFTLLNPKNHKEVDTVIITGGRYSLKSYTVSIFSLIALVDYEWNVLYTRFTNESIVDSVKPEVSDKIELLGYNGFVNDTISHIEYKSNRIAFKGIKTGSKQQTANLKSLSGFNLFVNDEAEELPDYKTFKKIFYSIRSLTKRNINILILNPTTKGHWIYQEFFKKRGLNGGENCIKENVMYIHSSYLDCDLEIMPQNILADYKRLKEENISEYNNIVLGGWVDEINNAIWKYSWIDKNRVKEHPTLKRVVVAIDPSVTATENSDECGLVVAGLGIDNQYYVLEDLSGIYTPNGWALKSIFLYEKHKADRIVAEVNNGGDLVETVIKNFDKSVAYKSVHASRGKVTRAEPIAALYEQNQVHHVGILKDLEYQMTTWDETQGISPGRIDALVWAITELSTPKVNTNSWA